MRFNDDSTRVTPGGENYVIGVDYGTLSGRAVVVRVSRRQGARERSL